MSIVYLKTSDGSMIGSSDGSALLYVGNPRDLSLSTSFNYSEEAWQQAMRQLMPEGECWDYDDPVLGGMLDSAAEEFSLVDARIDYAVRDQIPLWTVEQLPAWEAAVGLPDACLGSAGTLEERREMLLDKLSPFQAFTPASVVIRAWNLGFTLRIEEPVAAVCDEAVCGDPLDGLDMENTFVVRIPDFTIRTFKCGRNRCGDKFRSWGNTRLTCWIDRIKHTHTDVWYSYGDLAY